VQLFHYHLVTSRVREVEARYLAKLGFELVARYGRVGEEHTSFEPGVSWEELDRIGFKLRLAELERGSVNVVVQPGQWELPRVDHIGLALEEDDFAATLARADQLELRVQEHGARRTFIATGAGYRVELHPPRDWLEDLLSHSGVLSIAELQLKADDPQRKAEALGDLLELPHRDSTLEVGETVVRFVDGGPVGRPELHGELFV
jgi:catechol 2,3-dioxygenase-like lactoylglutathione lyase family enzyme